MEFARLITIKRSDVHAKGQGQQSSIKVTEVKTNFAPILAFPDRNFSLNSQKTTEWFTKLEAAYTRCPVVFLGHLSKRSHRTKIANIYLDWADCSSSCNSPMASKWCRHLRWHKKVVLLFFRIICQMPRSHRPRNWRFNSKLSVSGRWLKSKFTGGYQQTHIASRSTENVPCCFSRSSVTFYSRMCQKSGDLSPMWEFRDDHSNLNSSIVMK